MITEAGILQHEKVNNSDHRLYVIDVDMNTMLHLGPQWDKRHVTTDPKLQKLPLGSPKTSSEFQCRAKEL